ncbi:MAG: hypothetical protein J6X37_00135 [Treponema sp.]|uniref:1-phosphofructokinase family hexose kinase n=1 Tax=Treponema sp. TaxID=166 RepID=UPI001B474B4B|nr:PfkB family carbohydrate kinase [Treponema sp.]MBP5587123.1 hypothetical protein [Treponema sp.]MCR5387251.1 hypothetical protein [Treponema sp.]
MKKFLCICLSSTIQRTVSFDEVRLEKVNRSKHYRQDASGKAVNSARVLNQMQKGCAVCVCPLGQKNKELFLELASSDGLKIDYVEIPGFTRECWTLLDGTKATTTELVVGEPSFDFDRTSKENEICLLVEKELNECDAVLIAGSRPVYFSDDFISRISKMIFKSGKIFLADFHGKDLLSTLKCGTPAAIKINDDEFISTFGLDSDISDEVLKEKIIEKSKELSSIVIVTRGTKSTFAADCGKFLEHPVEKLRAVNTTACGDSFSAGFLYEYVLNSDLEKAIEKGTWCASRNAMSEVPGSILD